MILERAHEILAEEVAAISQIPLNDSLEHAIQAIRIAPGKVITTGMGKAGHIAKKFAATLCSTGTPSVYLHPGEASHGDLGLIQSGDYMVAFSTSGRTREVIETVVHGRELGLKKMGARSGRGQLAEAVRRRSLA